jgi:hypothetical protein
MQYVAPADGITGNRGKDRLGEVPDEMLEIEHVEARHVVFTNITGVAADFLVAARTKGIGPSSREDDGTDFEIFPRVNEGIDHFGHSARAKGVADVRAIDDDPRNSVIALFVHDVFVGADILPVRCHASVSIL